MNKVMYLHYLLQRANAGTHQLHLLGILTPHHISRRTVVGCTDWAMLQVLLGIDSSF